MTKNKRYTLNCEGIDDFDEYGLESPILLKGDVLTFGEVVDRLNEQEETIQRLKKIIKDNNPVLKEIERLKEIENRYNEREWETFVNNGW